MTEDERNLDLMVAELGSEVRKVMAENATLKEELATVQAHRDGLQDALARILAISRMAIWDGEPKGVVQVGPKTRVRECND